MNPLVLKQLSKKLYRSLRTFLRELQRFQTHRAQRAAHPTTAAAARKEKVTFWQVICFGVLLSSSSSRQGDLFPS